MSSRTKRELQELQGLPLRLKIMLTEQRIRDWVNEYGEDGVYVSFSGGKDSTVLLHIARKMYPDIKAVFSNTSLEFPEIVKFVETFSNVDDVRPKMPYVEVIKKYGYPMISKEVSECVHGARKYLTAVIEENSLNQSINQSINQKWHYQKYRQLCGLGEYKKYYGGGYENKYRKFRGIGAYATNTNGTNSQATASMASSAEMSENRHRGVGGEVWNFSKVTGIVTAQNTIDARLWKNYRQFAGSEVDGNQQEGRQSNDGDYP